eukprot:TRINITY_DN147_c0_g1_i5.p1 TRINITY_DN147_c0_g1~~TRINITY_DN147_c0_g1_i5.p1  ORF type:complete len:463 (+),score=99.14 TRINITY_DN147_c0_g1_i5:3240-4628(+)
MNLLVFKIIVVICLVSVHVKAATSALPVAFAETVDNCTYSVWVTDEFHYDVDSDFELQHGSKIDIWIQEQNCAGASKGGNLFYVQASFRKPNYVRDFDCVDTHLGIYKCTVEALDAGSMDIKISRLILHQPDILYIPTCPSSLDPAKVNPGKGRVIADLRYTVADPDIAAVKRSKTLCSGDDSMYAGRWSSASLARFIPYDCNLQGAVGAKIKAAVKSGEYLWIHAFGDSVTRISYSQFVQNTLKQLQVELNETFYSNALPDLRFGNGVAFFGEDARVLFTYHWYFVHGEPSNEFAYPLDSYMKNFLFNRSIESYGSRDLIHDWKKPNLTIVSVGSHDTSIIPGQYEQKLGKPFKNIFKAGYDKLMLNLVTAVQETAIPERFGPQELCRNSQRISALNAASIEQISKAVPEGSFLGVNDLYSVTFAGRTSSKVFHDAIHVNFPAAQDLEAITMLRALHLLHK